MGSSLGEDQALWCRVEADPREVDGVWKGREPMPHGQESHSIVNNCETVKKNYFGKWMFLC